MYKSELHNAKETEKILEKGSPNVFFRWYHKKEKGPTHHPGDNTVKTSRLDRIEQSINNLTNLAEQMNARFDNLEKDVNSLKQDVKDINTRLDYIVDANNLKDRK